MLMARSAPHGLLRCARHPPAALGREGRLAGYAALLARLEPELDRVRGAAAEAIASGTPA
jgi:hypothetical protein